MEDAVHPRRRMLCRARIGQGGIADEGTCQQHRGQQHDYARRDPDCIALAFPQRRAARTDGAERLHHPHEGAERDQRIEQAEAILAQSADQRPAQWVRQREMCAEERRAGGKQPDYPGRHRFPPAAVAGIQSQRPSNGKPVRAQPIRCRSA